MKYDSLGCIVREKYPEGHIANLADSCAETSRAVILGDPYCHGDTLRFVDNIGYLRHPALANVEGWNHADFSNDQFLPLIMAWILQNDEAPRPSLRIRGTKTIVSVGVFALMTKQYWLLNVANIVQGWLFNLKWRIGDGFKIERSEGQVQDWPNYLCTIVFLRLTGRWATLNQPKERCLAAIRKYYLEGDDAEPNAEWIVELYEKSFKPADESASLG